MSRLLPFLLGGTFGATTLSSVACNGKDQISFTLTKDAGSALGTIQTLGCSNQDGTLDSSAYTQNGDTYNFAFNPYTECVTTPDPNNAASYSVDFKILFSNAQTIGGQTMYFSGDQIELKCTFQSTYTLTSDLGGVNLEGDQLVGDEFTLAFTMTRTQSDYATAETGAVVANTLIYHTITSTTADNLGATDFSFVPSSIRLEKKNTNVQFHLWSSDMTSCGYTEVEFQMGYDSAAKKWTFQFKGFLLDTEQGAEYQVVADMELCNDLSTDAKCTAANAQCLAVTSVDLPTAVTSSISGYTAIGSYSSRGGIYSMVRVDELYIILTGQGTAVRSATAPYDLITDSRRDTIFNNMSEGYNRVYTLAWDAGKKLLIIAGSYNVYVFTRESNGDFTRVQTFASQYRIDTTANSNVHIGQIEIDGDRAYFYCQHYKDSNSNNAWVANIEIYDIAADNTLTHFKTTGDDLDGGDRYDAMHYNPMYIVGYTSDANTVRLYDKDGEPAKTFASNTGAIWGIKIIGNYIVTGTISGNGLHQVNLYDTDGNVLQTLETSFGADADMGQLTVDGNIIFVSCRYNPGVTVLSLENDTLSPYGPVHSSYNRAGEMNFNTQASYILLDTQAQPTKILAGNVGYEDFKIWQIDP